MDSIFGLGEAQRAAFLRQMKHSFGSTYICLWSYSPLNSSNCLKFLDGIFEEERNVQQASSSSGSFARRLFDAYCGTLHYVDLGYVPGFAFKNNLPYVEMKLDYLQTISHTEMQLHFYQGAGIKSLVFMGCSVGEIELGFSSPQVNLEMEMRKWFPVDFSRQTYGDDLITSNQTLIPTSSSSLSLDSFEIDSCSPSSLFNNIPTTNSFITEPSRVVPSNPMLETNPNHHAALTLIPTIESHEECAMARAFLTVLSSSTSSSSSQNISHGRAAFTRYRAAQPVRAPIHKQRNMLGRAVLFYRNLNMTRRTLTPTATQMHHVIQERKRREKLNESFQVLKTLLPQLPKKDKASVLSSTTEYLTSLKSQVEHLRKRNHALEMQLSTTQKTEIRGEDEEVEFTTISSTERVYVEIERVSSRERLVDLRVRLRSEECKLLDLVFGVLKMLHHQTNLSLLCVMQSNTRMLESTPLHALILRLKVEGNDFDECGIQEAVRRVVADLPN